MEEMPIEAVDHLASSYIRHFLNRGKESDDSGVADMVYNMFGEATDWLIETGSNRNNSTFISYAKILSTLNHFLHLLDDPHNNLKNLFGEHGLPPEAIPGDITNDIAIHATDQFILYALGHDECKQYADAVHTMLNETADYFLAAGRDEDNPNFINYSMFITALLHFLWDKGTGGLSDKWNERKEREQKREQAQSGPRLSCVDKIERLSNFIRDLESPTESEKREAKNLAMDCLKSALEDLNEIFKAGGQPEGDHVWDPILALSRCVAKLNMGPQDMPWHGQGLDEFQKKGISSLTRHIAAAFYNTGVELSKAGMHDLARNTYRRASQFDPEPELAVPLHFNWALAINQMNHNFQNSRPDQPFETMAEFFEMIAHFDEVIQQYEHVHENGMKASLQRLYEDAKRAVGDAMNLGSCTIHYSEAHGGRLVVEKPGGKAFPLRVTWTDFDLTLKEPQPPSDADKTLSLQALNRGMEHLEKQMLDEAIQELNSALQYDPDNLDAMVALGTALQYKEFYGEAIKAFEKALKRAPSKDAEGVINYNIGNAYKAQDKHEQAIPFYIAAIAADSEKANRHFNLGQCYLALMRFDEAIAEYDATLRLDPNHQYAPSRLEAAKLARDSGMADELRGMVKPVDFEPSAETPVMTGGDQGVEDRPIGATEPMPQGRKTGNKIIIGAVLVGVILLVWVLLVQNNAGNQPVNRAATVNAGAVTPKKEPPVRHQSAKPTTGRVTSDVNLRGGPGVENAKMGILKNNATARLLDIQKIKDGAEWCQIEVLDGPLKGKTGWVNRRYFEPF